MVSLFFFLFIIISISPSCRQDGADGARSSRKAGRPLPVSRLLLVLLVLVEEDLVLVQLVEEDRHGQRLPDAVRGEGWRRSSRLETLRRVGQLRGQAVQVRVLDSFTLTKKTKIRGYQRATDNQRTFCNFVFTSSSCHSSSPPSTMR